MAKDKRKNHDDNDELIAKSLEANEKERENYHTRRMNKFWMWLGVLVLIAILLWFIFFLGFSGWENIDSNG